MNTTDIDYSRTLTLYESFYLNGREVMRPIVQGMYSTERANRLKARANKAIQDAIDIGRYDYNQEVYLHPVKAKKPYLDKYKIS